MAGHQVNFRKYLSKNKHSPGFLPETKNAMSTEVDKSLNELKKECTAFTEKAVLYSVSERDEIRLTGKDRQQFLHSFCTNDINRLTTGEGCEAFISSIQGKTLGHIFVFAKEDALVLDSAPRSSEELIPHLDRYILSEDVALEETSNSRDLLYLTGSQATAILSKYAPAIENLKLYDWTQISLSGEGVTCKKVDWWGKAGFLLRAAKGKSEQITEILAREDVKKIGKQTAEALRIESGFPEFGIDFNSENFAQEIGRTELAISFQKGCYLGQEPIARIDALGHVNYHLRTLHLSSPCFDPESLRRENLICTAESNKSLGQITSVATLPTTNGNEQRLVALATIRREIAQPGTTILVKSGNTESQAIVQPNDARN